MSVVVVGGHTRNIGKTGLVAKLIAGMPERRWTAIKITQFGHGVCSANGEPCDCETADHTIAVSEERDASTGTDTSRYLAAGAAKSYWVRTRQGQLNEAMPRIRQLMAKAEDIIIESNSVIRFLRPDVFLSVLNPAVADFKPSALQFLDRADALVLPAGCEVDGAWDEVGASLLRRQRRFFVGAGEFSSGELVEFVREKLGNQCRE